MTARCTLFVSVLAAFLLCGSAGSATEFFVDATNGNDVTGNGSEALPWATIACADDRSSASCSNPGPPQSGDTVWIKGGSVSYTDQILPPGPGIAYRGYGSTRPVLVPVSVSNNSCIRVLNGRDDTTVDRIRCQGAATQSDLDFTGFVLLLSSGNVIEDSEFVQGDGNDSVSIQFSGNRFLRNLVQPNPVFTTEGCQEEPVEGCGAKAIVVQGPNNLIEDNLVLEGGHDSIQINSSFNVIRGNTFRNPNYRPVGIIAPNNSFDEDPAEHNVFEGNIVSGNLNFDFDNSQNVFQLITRKTIIRFNRFYDNTGSAIRISRDGSPVAAQYNLGDNRIYHNVFYENGQHGFYTVGFLLSVGSPFPPGGSAAGNLLLNNVFLHNDEDIEMQDPPPGVQIQFQGLYSDGLNGTSIRNNAIRYVNGGDAVIRAENPPLCDDGSTPPSEASAHPLSAFEACYPSLVAGNVEADPLFVDAPNGDFRIPSTSPMKNQGGFLTQTSSAGSGTVIPVVDALGFSDGFGLVLGDLIRISGSAATARITDVDYDTSVLTVDTSLSWTAGAGVHTAFKQGAPDIGVHEIGKTGCGLGGEVALLVGLLAAVRSRGRSRSVA